MANNLNPDICDVGNNANFDFTTVPKLGPNLEGLGDDLTAYLCNILKVSRREDLDPLLRAGTEYNNDVWIKALTGMENVGDPRFSMGELMAIGLQKYLKPLEIQLKILQEGCQVTDGVLCDVEGKEIPFYGKCETPDIQMFSYENLTAFVTDLWNESLDKHADDFVFYLKNKYLNQNWNIELLALGDDNLEQIRTGAAAPLFYVKLTKGTEDSVYYKYYFDRRYYISNALMSPIIIINLGEFQKNIIDPLNSKLLDVISGPNWPEKRKKDIFLSGEIPIFKPDKIYVDVSYLPQEGAETEIFITNDKWNGDLTQEISTDSGKVTYPENIYLTPIKPGGQYVSVRPFENGSFCVVLRDKGTWKNWSAQSEYKRSSYHVDITYKADKNNFQKISKDVRIASFARSYRGGSQLVVSPIKLGYSAGYLNIETTSLPINRQTCCVINNIWSLFV